MVELRTAAVPPQAVIAAAWSVVAPALISSPMRWTSALPTSARACDSPINSLTRVSSSQPRRRARGHQRHRAATRIEGHCRSSRRRGDVGRAAARWCARGTSTVSRPSSPSSICADALVVGHVDVGDELLAELPRAIEHLDAMDLDPRLVYLAA